MGSCGPGWRVVGVLFVSVACFSLGRVGGFCDGVSVWEFCLFGGGCCVRCLGILFWSGYGAACRDLVFFLRLSCRWRRWTSAVMIRCMVEARNMSASWIRVRLAVIMVCIDLVVVEYIGANTLPISGCAVVRRL